MMIQVNKKIDVKDNIIKHLLGEMVTKVNNIKDMRCSFSGDTPMFTITNEDACAKHMTKCISIHVISDKVIPAVTIILTSSLIL